MNEIKPEAELSQRKEYFTKKISEYLSKYPDNFRDFVKDEKIIEFGNELLSMRLITGYNVATFEQFPINSKESLIFYGVYAQRVEHLGELLARMEQEGIIREENVSFGIRATKVFGGWEDPETVTDKIII